MHVQVSNPQSKPQQGLIIPKRQKDWYQFRKEGKVTYRPKRREVFNIGGCTYSFDRTDSAMGLLKPLKSIVRQLPRITHIDSSVILALTEPRIVYTPFFQAEGNVDKTQWKAYYMQIVPTRRPDIRYEIRYEYANDATFDTFDVTADTQRIGLYVAKSQGDLYHSASNHLETTGTLNHRFNDEWSLRNTTRYYNYTLDRNNTLPGSVDEIRQLVSLNRSTVARAEHGWSNQTELVQKTQWAGMRHEILYGIEIGQQNKDLVTRSANGIATVNLFDPILPVLPRKLNSDPSANNLGRFNTLGLYLQDMVTINDHWKALVGLRYDRFKQRTEDRRLNQNLTRTDNAWSPRLGLVYQPDQRQSYYLSWSRSFQPSGEAFSLAASNADLAPETTTNTEVGAKYDFLDGALSTTISVFRLERDDIKVSDPVTRTLLPIGKQRTDGVELTIAGDLGDGVKILAGYAYLNARVTKSVAVDAGKSVEGKRATLTPRHSANLWITKEIRDGFGVGAGVNLVGARYADPGNTVTLPGYVTADAAVWWRKGPYAIQMNVNNLFDAGYIVSAHGTSPNLNLPGAPRRAVLSLQYQL